MSIRLKVIGANQTEVSLGDRVLFFSYDTLVAVLRGGVYYRADPSTVSKWSKTTTKHVNAWLPANCYQTVSHNTLQEIADE